MNLTQLLFTNKSLRLLGIAIVATIGTLVFAINTTHSGGSSLCPNGVCAGDRVQRDTNRIVDNTNDMTRDMHYRATEGDRMAHEQSQRALRGVVDNMIDFVNTGVDGDPAFITNLNQYLTGAVDAQVQNFIQGLGGRMDTPFLADIQGALQQVHTRNMRGELPGYSASSVGNINAFLDGDFGQGGWEGFMEVISDPSANTPVGAYFTARQEMNRVAQSAMFEEVTKANWGDGFRSLEECDANQQNCQITTPGTVIADQLNRALGSSFDSLVAANQMDQTIEDTFARLSEEAITGANGLLGISLDAGAIFNAILQRILEDGGGEGSDISDEELRQAIEMGDQFINDTLSSASNEEENFFNFIEDVLADESITLTEEQEADLLEQGNQSQLNLVQLNELLIRNQQRAEEAATDPSLTEADILLEIQSEYSELRNDLHNAADIALIRNELGL